MLSEEQQIPKNAKRIAFQRKAILELPYSLTIVQQNANYPITFVVYVRI